MAKTKRRQSHKKGTCAYCAEQSTSLTEEHVIPRNLSSKPLPAGERWLIVWTCERCNNEKAALDTYMRDLLVSDIKVHNHEGAREIFRGKFSRAVRRNQSHLIREAASKAKMIALQSPGGIYLGQGVHIPIDNQRLTRFFGFVVRGLYFLHLGRHLPQDQEFRVVQADNERDWLEFFQQTPYEGPMGIAGIFRGAFLDSYKFEGPHITMWTMIFFDRILYIVETLPKGFDLESFLITQNKANATNLIK